MKNNIKHIWRVHLTFRIASGQNCMEIGTQGMVDTRGVCMPRNSLAAASVGISDLNFVKLICA